MGRIFVSAGHGGLEDGVVDPGVVVGQITEAKEMILTRDLIVADLQARGFEVLSVPDDLSLSQTIGWINSRHRLGDIALEIHANAASNATIRGSSVYYIANNEERRNHAELLLLALLRRVPQFPNRGAKPDTTIGVGSLSFCRQVIPPSLLMEIGVLSNADDRDLIQNRRRDVAVGLADGLASWSRTLADNSASPRSISDVASLSTPGVSASSSTASLYPPISININGQVYGEPGIIVNGNSYVPIDLADRLGVNLTQAPNVRRFFYGNVVYIRAIDLREHNISVGWDAPTRTVLLRSILQICPGQIDRITGHGKTTEVQLLMFLKANHEAALTAFPDIAKLYREEGEIEGINYDIAFAQMCIETNFLRFGGTVQPSQNNFAGLGDASSRPEGASFPSARLGVRAQTQHLKAYANTEPLVQQLVDPRFNFVTRGIAPLVDMLSGRWSADATYGARIKSMLRQLYEASGLL